MSDSASKKGVEDVLTSVRRLVSSELPRTRRPELPKGPGALVLTDAQRVKRAPSRGEVSKSLEDRIAELELAVSTRTDDYEPDGSEDQAQHRPNRIVYTRPPSDGEEAEARGMTLRLHQLSVVASEDDEPEDETEGMEEMPTPSFRHSRPPTEDVDAVDEAPMAEDVQPAAPEADLRPFHDPDDMVERFEARITGQDDLKPGPGHNGGPERLAPYNEPRKEEPQTARGEEPVRELDEAPARYVAQTQPDPAADEAAFEAALSAAVAGDPVAEAPDVPEPVGQDEIAPEAVSDASASVEPDATEVEGSDAPSTEIDSAELLASAIVDEEALRPIVAKLIREELQGELGERITRNVRKLVRNEVLRVLAAKDIG